MFGEETAGKKTRKKEKEKDEKKKAKSGREKPYISIVLLKPKI